MVVLDIADPTNIELISRYDAEGATCDLAVSNDIIYCSDTYYFSILKFDDSPNFTSKEVSNNPTSFALHNAYPNPFNSSTAISYQLLAVSNVNLTIYDITGREVAKLVDGMKSAGEHQVVFDAGDLTSGVYFVRLDAGDFKQTRKILLVK